MSRHQSVRRTLDGLARADAEVAGASGRRRPSTAGRETSCERGARSSTEVLQVRCRCVGDGTQCTDVDRRDVAGVGQKYGRMHEVMRGRRGAGRQASTRSGAAADSSSSSASSRVNIGVGNVRYHPCAHAYPHPSDPFTPWDVATRSSAAGCNRRRTVPTLPPLHLCPRSSVRQPRSSYRHGMPGSTLSDACCHFGRR